MAGHPQARVGERPAKAAVVAPLTGIRLVAAVWVVLFHIYLFNGDWLASSHPDVDAVVGPIVSQGDLGVDLFFLLSGFVLGRNYLVRLGESPSLRGAMSFLWLRIARVWPLYMTAILGGGLLLSLRLQLWGTHPNVPLSWTRFLEQLVMVQQWAAPNVPNTSWTGPAWSISAEWLAYCSFPLLAVAVLRLHRRTGRGTTLALAGAVLVPTLLWTGLAQTQAAPFMWLARLASEFTCGVLLSAALAEETPGLRRAASRLVPVSLGTTALWLYLAHGLDRDWLGPLVLAVFPLLVVGLAHGDGLVHRWLGSPAMVLGGGVSFALYLVHVPLLKLFRDAADHGAIPVNDGDRLYGELAVAVLSLLLAYLLFRHVEEPVRHRLRTIGPRVVALALRLRVPPAERIRPVPMFSEHVVEQQARRMVA